MNFSKSHISLSSQHYGVIYDQISQITLMDIKLQSDVSCFIDLRDLSKLYQDEFGIMGPASELRSISWESYTLIYQ